MQIKPGIRLRSTVDSTEVVVVRAPAGPVDIRCGGFPMATLAESADGAHGVAAGFEQGSVLGKRYEDDAAGVELVCTKAGAGSLSIGETLMDVKDTKPLPSSD